MKKTLLILMTFICAVILGASIRETLGAPTTQYAPNLYPDLTDIRALGSSALKWGTFWTKNATTTNLSITGLANCDTIDTDAFGNTKCGTDANSGGAGGSGNVATSTAETAGQLAYWTSTGATPATLGQVATSSLTASAPLSLSNVVSFIGSVGSAISCAVATGSVSGCLSSTDWTTFNNKQATISATYPIVLTGATLSTPLATTTIAQTYGTNQIGAITFATSSDTNLGLNITNTAGAFTFTPTWLGTLANARLTNSTISGIALGSTLNAHTVNGSLSGTSYNGSAAVSDWSINLGNVNVWTGGQTFANATMTNATTTTFAVTGLFHFFTQYWNSLAEFATYIKSLFSATYPITYSSGVIGVSSDMATTSEYFRWSDRMSIPSVISTDENAKFGSCLESGGKSVTVNKVDTLIASSTLTNATNQGVIWNLNIGNTTSSTSPMTLFSSEKITTGTTTVQSFTPNGTVIIPSGYCYWFTSSSASTSIGMFYVNLFGNKN